MPLITISSPIGCNEMEVATIVAQGLGVEIYDDEKLLEMGRKIGLGVEHLKDMIEPGFLDRLFSQKPLLYMDYMDSIVYEVSRKGEGVILGHGSQMLLRDFDCALHIRMHAPKAKRMKYFTEKQGLSEEAAYQLIDKTDTNRRGLFRMAFGRVPNDPSLYDLIINTNKMTVATAAKIIMDAAQSEVIKQCSLGALESMKRLSQEKRVKAALLENHLDNNMLVIEVPADGIIEVKGLTHSQGVIDRIEQVIKQVPGIKEVRLELIVAPVQYGRGIDP
ncbi:MAG: cytidylate kinase family protein [Thermodesulfobacteriota bacterium]